MKSWEHEETEAGYPEEVNMVRGTRTAQLAMS